ncbi:amino acid adenylation domain-containing protein [Chitinophaga oryzae]|uniref:Amino acid adenylation domain-containing protein n=1 Tax=Chitinophaga oryzae TaxID=2725414 RepID=A0AAE6ZFC9_9BACT|nr:non-ribosomal peptide synthetase [Chitinophaga oryzae]QJB31611.1 amino acid adenylation domain-containing protein [Chitinophaga oryzae]
MKVSIENTAHNLRIYILDEHDLLVPVGVAGKICVGYDHLSAIEKYFPGGPAHSPAPDPFRKDGWLCRTGDTGRWLEAGRLELLTDIHITDAVSDQPVPAATAFETPRSTFEQQLLDIWRSVLGKQEISIHDDFFRSGGHSLKAVQLFARVRQLMGLSLQMKDVFTHTTIAAQAAFLEKAATSRESGIVRAPHQSSYPLSHAQRRFWMLSQFEERSRAYHIANVCTLKGQLDKKALQRALSFVLNRHESLRTVFRLNEAGDVRQHVLPVWEVACAPRYEDITGSPDAGAALRAIGDREQLAVFDLSTAPLFRLTVVKTGDDEHVLFYTMHHIISDGWSMLVLLRDVMAAYNALRISALPELPRLDIQYKDYAHWQEQYLQGDTLTALEHYWMNQLSGELPVTELPLDYPRPLVQSFSGHSMIREMPASPVAALRTLCHTESTTLFTGLLSALSALLFRYTGQEDMIIGTPAGGREQLALEDQIGVYLNTLPLRMQPLGGASFGALLTKTKEVLLGAYEHQAYPFNMLTDKLAPPVNIGRSPLFDVMVVMQNQENITLDNTPDHLEGITTGGTQEFALQTSQVDLTFTFTERDGKLFLQITYNTALFKEATINRLFTHFFNLLREVTACPGQHICFLKYLSDEEEQQQLYTFNHTAVAYPSTLTIADLFEAQADSTPDAVALVYEDQRMTYRELDDAANRLAHHLMDSYHVKPDMLVGVMMDKSALMMIGILGILKAGAAYVPVDRGYPAARAGALLQDATVQLLITDSAAVFDLIEYYQGDIMALDLQLDSLPAREGRPARQAGPAHLAYVMYTSGSTGRPKGVMVTHQSVVRLVKNTGIVAFSGQDVLLSTGAVSFDAVTFEYWGMLLNGGRLVLAGRETLLDYTLLGNLVRKEAVTMMWFTASWFNQLVDADASLFATLAVVLVGGDRLSPHHIGKLRALYPSLVVINGYGPTENTTFSATWQVTDDDVEDIPIGLPVSNSTCYILDANRQLLPLGLAGELYVGGDGLARGYLQAPELTETQFIPHPFVPGERLYRTGDMCRYRPDGVITFLGRKDQQVKIRGHRVEPAEVAAAISRVAGVTQAVVTVIDLPGNDKGLAAYFTALPGTDVDMVSAALTTLLPEYMQPQAIMLLDQFPLNANGKVAAGELPPPDMTALRGATAAYLAPRNETEERLSHIWEEVLERKNIGVNDHFFDLGGHSLKAIQLISRIRKEWSADVQIKDIFSHPRLAEMAALIAVAGQQAVEEIPALPPSEYYVLSNAQLRFWVLSRFTDSSLAYNMALGLRLNGPLEEALLKAALHTVVSRHESLRTVFRQTSSGEVMQYVQPPEGITLNWNYRDISGEPQPEQALKTIYAEEQLKPFDLRQGPLLRTILVKIAPNDHAFFYTMHHIISDGWSMQVLAKEVVSIYNALLHGRLPDLPPLRIQYRDYAAWQQSRLDQLQQQEDYWMRQLEGDLPVLDLFPGKTRPPIQTHHGDSLSVTLLQGNMEELYRYCNREAVTPFMLLLASIKGLFHRYTGQEDIIVGIPVAGREQQELENQIGIYLNTLPLRTRFNAAQSFRELLLKEKEVLLEAYGNQECPFDRLLELRKVNRDVSRSALFDVLVVLQNQSNTNIYNGDDGMEGLTASYIDGLKAETSQFDLTFSFAETSGGIQLSLSYNTDVFEREEIVRLSGHYAQFLAAVLKDAGVPLSRVDYISEGEKRLLLQTFNDNSAAVHETITVPDILAMHMQRQPDAPAVTDERGTVTYRMLEKMAGNMAYRLQTTYGVKKGDLVVILADRSSSFVAAILAIWKCGAAYVPIDPDYPASRVQAIINASSPAAVVCDEKYQALAGGSAALINLLTADGEENIPTPVQLIPADLAYVIFTSGSTGEPKGVMIEHQGMLNHLYAKTESLEMSATSVVAQNASQSFDISVWQFFAALITGGRTVIYSDQEIFEPLAWWEKIRREGVTILEVVPSYLSLLLDLLAQQEERPALSLRYLVVTGETLKAVLVRKWFEFYPHVPMVNAYGPTEASDDITHHFMTEAPLTDNIPIGKPVRNMNIYVLDAHRQLCPVGVAGEIYVAGIGVGRGYLNDPEKTAGAFMDSPFGGATSERMYKTGDVGRFLPDGSIEFYGRKDYQVKIRGNRIEPGEIESVLLRQESVKAAEVLPMEGADGRTMLVAYVVAAGDDVATRLRDRLAGLLPDYMVPAHIIAIGQMPLTPNGKTDRRALEKMLPLEVHSHKTGEPPADDMEASLVNIWEEVLGLDGIGVNDSFFELGGHSLGVIRILNAVQQQFDVKVDMRELFKRPTVRQLALEIKLLHALREPAVTTNNHHSKEIII